MCTVSFIPQQDGFILSSNRDESPLRSKSELVNKFIGKCQVIYPSDHKGGTWLAISDHGDVLCLLNGAFEKHQHRPPYAMSRGLMLLSYFKYDNISDFLYQFDFDGIEPFTLVIHSKENLYEFRWDGMKKYIQMLNPKINHLWSSSTLYDKQMRNARVDWFTDHLKSDVLHDLNFIKNLHRTGGSHDPRNGYVMNRDEIVKTVSISHVVYSSHEKAIYFEDLEQDSTEKAALT